MNTQCHDCNFTLDLKYVEIAEDMILCPDCFQSYKQDTYDPDSEWGDIFDKRISEY